jgi:4-hydroxy-3-methylbut-2-en-1-yl diphosphate reductase
MAKTMHPETLPDPIAESQPLGVAPTTRDAPSATYSMDRKPPVHVLLAGPGGCCAGVDRAIQVVEEALRRCGAPVYVRHEIVHNRTVVEQFKAQGAVFVEELDEVPAEAQVVFSAHGVPKLVRAEAQRRNLFYLDATCPLVSKVHREAERPFAGGGPETRHILRIGYAGRDEVMGTMGQLPPEAVTLVQSAEDARGVQPPAPERLAFITQTTLSVDETDEIVAILRERFPTIEGPRREDICYATTNRQAAVKTVAEDCELVVVIGSPNSHNSQRPREVAERAGTGRAICQCRVTFPHLCRSKFPQFSISRPAGRALHAECGGTPAHAGERGVPAGRATELAYCGGRLHPGRRRGARHAVGATTWLSSFNSISRSLPRA